VEKRLPLPPEALSKRYKDDFGREELGPLTALAESYKSAPNMPAWNDLYGRLYQMHSDTHLAILQGRHDDWGNDLTPKHRAVFGLLENIIAIPAKIEARRAFLVGEDFQVDLTQ
jgi:hypothetical protein